MVCPARQQESKKENKTCKELRLVRSFLLSGFHRESLKVYAYFFRGLFFTDCKCVKIVLDAGGSGQLVAISRKGKAMKYKIILSAALLALGLASSVSANSIKHVFVVDELTLEVEMADPLTEEELHPPTSCRRPTSLNSR